MLIQNETAESRLPIQPLTRLEVEAGFNKAKERGAKGILYFLEYRPVHQSHPFWAVMDVPETEDEIKQLRASSDHKLLLDLDCNKELDPQLENFFR